MVEGEIEREPETDVSELEDRRPVNLYAGAGAGAGGCAAGYRAADDKYAAIKKVRFKPDEVIVRV